MFLQVLKIEFCLYFFKKWLLIGYVWWAFQTGSPVLNCILPLCLPLDI